ncbi:JAB domain-containing protein [Termitidicoccus mucosus]|uniref:JAB domain-containing protein n=1 Tax=Termitidicoccus mucosus TaxID=1184151 RepID=UPI003CCB9A0E
MPSVICVTLVFSGESRRPRSLRNASIKGRTSCSSNSRDPAPSDADIRVIRGLKEAARILDIDLVDHVIVGDINADPRKVGYFSFHEQGLL